MVDDPSTSQGGEYLMVPRSVLSDLAEILEHDCGCPPCEGSDAPAEHALGVLQRLLSARPAAEEGAYDQGFREGIEAAAKAADDQRTDDDSMWDRCAVLIAREIRSLAQTGGKG